MRSIEILRVHGSRIYRNGLEKMSFDRRPVKFEHQLVNGHRRVSFGAVCVELKGLRSGGARWLEHFTRSARPEISQQRVAVCYSCECERIFRVDSDRLFEVFDRL